MLRIIESCIVKMENREKKTETKKGDRMDDQRRKFALYDCYEKVQAYLKELVKKEQIKKEEDNGAR